MIKRYINRFTKKIIEAEQITIGKLNKRNGIEKSDMNPDDEGYYFEEHSLKCWMHKKDFEYKYCPLNADMSFGDAIELLKMGYKMQRKGWNGKNQFIELAINISYVTCSGEIVNSEHEAIGNKAIAFVGTSGVQIGWLASQADMLAEDWIVVE